MSSETYYNDPTQSGNYQYVLLKDIINNFMLMNVGDDKIIDDIVRYQVVHYAKRAIQELNYDALKEVKKIEIELSESLRITMPPDYVQVVRLSWLDDDGKLHPLVVNRTNAIAEAYMQDNSGSFLFDVQGELQNTESLAEIRSNVNTQRSIDYDSLEAEHTGGRFGMSTADSNKNGGFIIDKQAGQIKFSSHLSDGTIIILEYISDGLSSGTDTTLRVNKLAEDYIYSYLQAEIVNRKFGVQEYIVRRAKKEASAKLRNAKIRLMNVNFDDLVQSLKGKDKWIK